MLWGMTRQFIAAFVLTEHSKNIRFCSLAHFSPSLAFTMRCVCVRVRILTVSMHSYTCPPLISTLLQLLCLVSAHCSRTPLRATDSLALSTTRPPELTLHCTPTPLASSQQAALPPPLSQSCYQPEQQ